ncbi:response regulator [Flavobacterium sp. 3-210]
MKQKYILQIDDDPDDCQFFQEVIASFSMIVYSCIQNPIEALNKLTAREISPDIIFLDLNMPLMNGIEFLNKIKKIDILKNIPVIIFSTSSADQDKKTASISGAQSFFTKPYSVSDLREILQKII